MTQKKYREIAAALSLAIFVAATTTCALANDYKLGIADRIKIKVQEWPYLDGEYAVTPDGSVALPLVGNIKVVGRQLSELSQDISDRLQQRSAGSARALAAVEIAQYRPFAITGDIQRPGEYPYRPRLTVIQAISIAGGYYRPELGLLRLGRDVVNASGELRTQSVKLNRLIIRDARLSAAVDGRDQLSLPPELAKLKDDPTIATLMKNERDALSLANDVKRSEQAAYENVKKLYLNEIDTLHGQIQALTQEQDSIETQLKEMRSMAARGLALSPTMFALERSLGQVRSQQMFAQTNIVRAQESITLAEQKVIQAQQDRARLDRKELQQTRDEIAETRAKIATQSQLVHEAQTSAPAEARDRLSEEGERQDFIILRRVGETVRELTADETTLVEPDDIIKVPSVRPPPAGPSGPVNLSRADAPDR
jgi:protein involved in polysaccharide export with SLBB domain